MNNNNMLNPYTATTPALEAEGTTYENEVTTKLTETIEEFLTFSTTDELVKVVADTI